MRPGATGWPETGGILVASAQTAAVVLEHSIHIAPMQPLA